jgi:hypothetical protein
MVIGLIIKQNGENEILNFTLQDVTNGFNRFIENCGVGPIECFDMIEEDNGFYLFYGWKCGYNNFNMFEFPRANVYGDAFVIFVNRNREAMDIDTDNFNNLFECEDLDDTLLEDELEEENEYNLEDSFIASDDSEDSDYLDYVDYP